MTTKPFSQELYNQDDGAKIQVIEWLEGFEYEAWINPDDFDIDVLAKGKGRSLAFEVEVKHNWNGAWFPFDTLHYSARKLKFLGACEDLEIFFMTLNHERSHALLVDYESLTGARIVTKDTKYTKGEQFIEVPIGKCQLIAF